MVYFNQCDQAEITNSTIQYSSQTGLRLYLSSDIVVENLDISNNNGYGILNSSSAFSFNNCQLNNNSNWAAYFDNATIRQCEGNSGNGNGYDAFAISGTIDQEVILSEAVFGFPFVINGLVTINPGATVSIPPGEVIKLTSGLIKNQGTLIADGMAKSPVVFTSFKDDEYGGDLNKDGFISAPAPGDWYMVSVNGQNANDGVVQLDHCLFRYGGANYGGEQASLYFHSNHPESFVSYCTVEYSATAGLKSQSATIKVRSSTFRENLSYNIHVIGTAVPDLGQPFENDGGFNHFESNPNVNIQMYYSGTTDVFAYYNDWGFYTESEIDSRIYDDDEFANNGKVLFNPWFDPADETFFLDPEFTVDFTKIHVGGNLNFTDQSTGFPAPNGWEWDFQTDGLPESEFQNPSWAYGTEGFKTVCLVVRNGAYEVTLIKEDFINVGNYGAADISGVTDVPDDQGGWVYVNFTKSEFDTNTLVTSTEYYTVQLNDGNGWFSAGYSSAYGFDSYSVIAHTPFDSTQYNSGMIDFRVIASMDEGTYVSDVVQGYSVDNIKPMAPSGLETLVGDTIVYLSWDESPDDDFHYFGIYRSESETSFPDEPYQTLTGTSFTDTISLEDNFYYMITAFDYTGNESDGSQVANTFRSVELQIPQGWSGISTFLEPVDKNIENMFAPIAPNLILMENQSGIYWPGENINTLVDWNLLNGYVIKTSAESDLQITSTRAKFNSIELTEGWNIIPVLSQFNVNVAELFIDADIEIVKEVAGWRVYWPDVNVNSLGTVNSRKAYFVKSNIDQTIIFPDLGTDAQALERPQEFTNVTPWNDLALTPSSHTVAFTGMALDMLQKGDFIAAITPEGNCAGLVQFISENTGLTIFGDDGTTPEKEGFVDGETLVFKIYRPESNETFEIEVSYNPDYNQGTFEDYGLSEITSLKLSATGISEFTENDIDIYPNPSNGIFNIEGFSPNASMAIFNAFGEEIMSNDLIHTGKIDLSNQPNGVYFLRIETPNGSLVKKLVKE